MANTMLSLSFCWQHHDDPVGQITLCENDLIEYLFSFSLTPILFINYN